jgi:hypothetical protein
MMLGIIILQPVEHVTLEVKIYMTKKLFVVTALLLMIFGNLAYANKRPPFMGNIETIPAPEGNWVYLPEGDGELIIHVSTAYANKLKVWRVPTGTQQWENRTLVCEDKGIKDNWTCIWRYSKDDNIHDHFVVEAIGEGESSKSSINVTRRHTKNHPQ